jgi:hypothetical protein
MPSDPEVVFSTSKMSFLPRLSLLREISRLMSRCEEPLTDQGSISGPDSLCNEEMARWERLEEQEDFTRAVMTINRGAWVDE